MASFMIRQRSHIILQSRCLNICPSAYRCSTTAVPHEETRSFNEIPGPRPIYPLIGNILRKRNSNSLIDIQEMLDSHGPIYREKLGPRWMLYITDPEDVKTMYKYEGKYPDRGSLGDLEKVYVKRQGVPASLITLENEPWFTARRIGNPHLMKANSARPFLSDQVTITDDLIEHLRQERDDQQEVYDMWDWVVKYSMEVAGMVTYDMRLGAVPKYPEREMPSDISKCMAAMHISTSTFEETMVSKKLPFYKFFNTALYRKYRDSRNITKQTTGKCIRDAQRRFKDSQDDSSLRVPPLMRALKSVEGASDQQVEAILSDVFGGAQETTTTSASWLMYNLATNQDKQQLLREEIQTVLPDGQPPKEDSFDKMPYLKAVMKENFRLSPIGLSSAFRVMPCDVTMSGYNVPRGTMVLACQWHTTHMEKYFPEPFKFLPERWLRDGSKKRKENISPYLVMPFGHGVRMCLGRRLAEQTIMLLAVRMLQSFHMDYKHEDVGIKVGAIFRPDKPLRITLDDI